VRAVGRGTLLTGLVPAVGEVLGHVVALGLMRARSSDGRQLSAAGGDLVPSTVVVDPTELADPWTAASILLHEALHLRLGRGLIRDGGQRQRPDHGQRHPEPPVQLSLRNSNPVRSLGRRERSQLPQQDRLHPPI
jgi:hypothetical protein